MRRMVDSLGYVMQKQMMCEEGLGLLEIMGAGGAYISRVRTEGVPVVLRSDLVATAQWLIVFIRASVAA